MSAWTVADLLRHLEDRGLHLHPCPTRQNGPIIWNVYLTREERPWTDYGGYTIDPARIHRWSGAVYCERVRRDEAREFELASWRECGLRAGPFFFFGDPEMLTQIRGALASSP
jgi:hypothetical protein